MPVAWRQAQDALSAEYERVQGELQVLLLKKRTL
jgi:hypothetical protein